MLGPGAAKSARHELDLPRKWELTQDIVIPAGTVLGTAPTILTRHTPHIEASIGHTADHVSFFVIDLEEALELGLVKEAE